MELGSLSDWMSISLIVVGIVVGWVQWQKEKKYRRAQFLGEVLKGFTDKNWTKAFYNLIERPDKNACSFYDGEFKFNKVADMSSSEVENGIDYMLLWCNYLCYMKLNGNMADAEFMSLSYQINRILRNDDIQKYLNELRMWKNQDCPFSDLILYAEEELKIELGAQDKDGKSESAEFKSFEDYLASRFGRDSNSYRHYKSYANTIDKILPQGVDALVRDEESLAVAVKSLGGWLQGQGVNKMSISSYSTGLRHYYNYKHGVWPQA